MFSSKSNEWETPHDLFNKLNKIYNFTLDPCSTYKNHKCNKYYTIKEDGLKQDWSNEVVFVNPPYERKVLKLWIKKCYEESLNGTTIVLLIPARTDTKYQHDIIFKYAKSIVFIKGRIKFINNKTKNSAPFPSQIVIFDNNLNDEKINMFKEFGYLVLL